MEEDLTPAGIDNRWPARAARWIHGHIFEPVFSFFEGFSAWRTKRLMEKLTKD